MEKRLRMVQDQLEKLRRINEEQNKEENDEEKDEREIVKTPRTLKELEKKYPHLKGKDGKINSRHVLDILKYEDQQQQKVGITIIITFTAILQNDTITNKMWLA